MTKPFEQRTPQEIEELKRNWLADGIWDIEETEGFEAHREELIAFRLESEQDFRERKAKAEFEIDEKARKLGVEGLYKLFLQHEELLERHQKALYAMGDGDSLKAYRILKGFDE